MFRPRINSVAPTGLSRALLVFVACLLCEVATGRERPTANLKYNEFVTHLDFDNYVKETSDTLWAVEFYAPWCPHCQRFAPTWADIASTMHDLDPRIKFGVVNCVASSDLCTLFSIKGYPTVKTVYQGQTVDPFTGERGKAAVIKWLSSEITKFTGDELDEPPASKVKPADPSHPGSKFLNLDGSSILTKSIVKQVPLRLGDLASTLVFFLDSAPFLGVETLKGAQLTAFADFLGVVADNIEQKQSKVTLRKLRVSVLAHSDTEDSDTGIVLSNGMTEKDWDIARKGLYLVSGVQVNTDGEHEAKLLPATLSETGTIDDLPWDTCQGANHQ